MRLPVFPEKLSNNPVYRYELKPYRSSHHGIGELWLTKTDKTEKSGKPIYRALLLWANSPEREARVIFDDATLAGWGVPDELAAAALSFFTVTEHDVDDDYFDSYNHEQLDWRDDHAGSVALLAEADNDEGAESLSHLLIG